MKLHVKKGDKVVVISGNNKGSQGTIQKVSLKDATAIVEGINMVKRHTKPSAQNPNGGIVEKEAPLHVSKLMLIEPKSGKASRVGRTKDEKTGKNVRITKKSGEVIK